MSATERAEGQAAPAASAPASPPSKSSTVQKLLRRAHGATLAELCAATAWQPHSMRAFLTGLRKKGAILDKDKRRSGESSYRLSAQIKARDA